MNKKLGLGLALGTGLALVGLFLAGVWLMPVSEPVEAAWPTPQNGAFGGGDFVHLDYMNATSIATTTKTCGTGQQTAAYVLVDIQTQLDMNTGITQAITCTLEFSNDNSNWCVMPIQISTAITDFLTTTVYYAGGPDCEEVHLFGRYSRACCESSATDRYTVTHRAKAFN